MFWGVYQQEQRVIMVRIEIVCVCVGGGVRLSNIQHRFSNLSYSNHFNKHMGSDKGGNDGNTKHLWLELT